MRSLAAAFVVAFAFPATAWAEATLVTRELPVNADRTLAAGGAPEPFNLLGLHWRGPGEVFFRVRRPGGWSAWHRAGAEPEDLPDRGTDEARRAGSWRIGNPWWTGTAERVQIRTRGRVTRVRAHFVSSPEELSPGRSLQIAGAPPIISRRAWGANERIRRDNPEYAPMLTTAIVHHTAGASGSSPGQSAAIVRAIQTYHVRGNGWDDVGYNFLVDRFGQVFEGRWGGIERNVIGAHAQGFNTGSTGIALLGSYGGAGPSAAARNALQRLISWRLDVAHLDPLSTAVATSSGNPRFRKGVPVFLRAVSGHRDTGYTSCPGTGLYGQLNPIAGRAAALGLPKLYAPEVEGSPGGFISFSARLSTSLPWTVTVANAAGQAIAAGAGAGTNVRWTWDARLAPVARYTYRIAAGPNVRPAVGTIAVTGGRAGALRLDRVRADPSGFTPNGDGITDSTRISFRLNATATVWIDLESVDGTPLQTLFTGSKRVGQHVFAWNGGAYADGRYRIVVTAQGQGGRQLSAFLDVVLSRTLSGFSVKPAAVSPNGDGRNDSAAISFSVGVPATVHLAVLRGGAEVLPLLSAPVPAGPQALNWNGAVADGDYRVALTVTDAVGPVTQVFPLRVDRVRPGLSRVSRRPLRVSLSEPARVTLIVDGVPTTVRRPRAGVFRVVLGRPTSRIVAFAEDPAGNVGPRIRLR